MKRMLMLTIVIFAVSGGAATAGKLMTSSDIKNGTIKTVDMSSSAKRALKGQVGPRGPQGSQGAPGPQGPAGPASGPGASNRVKIVTASVTLAPGVVSGPLAYCPTGTVVVGTGFYASIAHVGFVQSFGGSFVGGGFINDTGIDVDVEVQALCAPGSPVATAKVTAAKDRYETKLGTLHAGN